MLLQKHLEETIQSALNKILGEGKSIVFISLVGEDEKWQINYTNMPQIPGLEDMQGVAKQQTIMPGIPSLKFMSESSSGGGVPLNYEVVQIPAQVKNKEVVLILDSKIKLGELRGVKLFVAKFLNLDETKGDKLTILKENFSDAEKNDFSSRQKLTTKSKFNPLVILAIIIAVIGAIAAIFIFFKLIGNKNVVEGKPGQEKPVVLDDSDKPETDVPEDENKKKTQEEEEKITKMAETIMGNGARYFNFINEENVYKLKFLLQVKIALQQATPKTISVVMACLPFRLASSILVEYPSKIQSEIVNNLLTLQHYPEEDIVNLESEIKENIEYLFGGKYRLQQILEKLSGEEKKKILHQVSKLSRVAADELSSLVVLFEDILSLDQQILSRIYNDIDTEVIAISLINVDKDLQKKIMESLPKGVYAMVDQWLSLKVNSASKYDIEQARQKVITYAQHLEREGFIKLSHE